MPDAIPWRYSTLAVRLLTASALVVGYTLLWRGGTGLAAALLVVAYVVAIPTTILYQPRAGSRSDAS